jgi:predicted DNA-binding transcriptional regulator AlpA
MKPVKTITIVEILKLFKKYFEVEVSRTAIYYYQKHKGFPRNVGLGKPARWPEDQVMKWIKSQIDKTSR